jgi:endoglucanase Acf2
MKKIITICFLLFIHTFCFSVPDPGGSASIKQDLSGTSVATPVISRTPSFSKPYPTNKWYNSLIYNDSSKPSLGMYTQPQLHIIAYQTVAQQRYTGSLLIGYPILTAYSGGGCFTYSSDLTDPTRSQLCITATDASNNPKTINTSDVRLKSFSDWACTVDNGQYEATFGQGMLFSYFNFKNSSNAMISFPNSIDANNYFKVYTSSSVQITTTDSFYADKIILEVKSYYSGNSSSSTRYYGIFLPSGSQIKLNAYSGSDPLNSTQFINITFPSSQRYMSVGLMTSKEDLNDWYKYAYNFVTDTKASYDIDSRYKVTTNFQFTFDVKRTDAGLIANQTLFAVMPHQYKNNEISLNYFNAKEFPSIRGRMKAVSGNKFSTKYGFCGIVPFFNHTISSSSVKTLITNALATDKNANIDPAGYQADNTYYYGKNLAKIANLITVADNAGDTSAKNLLISRLRAELANWFTYSSAETKKFFAYDSNWGGLIGIKNGFGTEKYTDHHFHYGYFIYASAILAMYDDDFANRYGGMVELLIKDIANISRTDANFPYMRYFDVYEGHSWADGMGGGEISSGGFVYSDSTNEESSSEAMNAWAAIYLWGMATNRTSYSNYSNSENNIKLGIWLYTNHYQSLRDYYFDVDSGDSQKEIYPSSLLGTYGNHGSIGILFGGRGWYYIWWTPTHGAREIKGIQIFPVTPSMLYLGYDKDYAENNFYAKMLSEAPGDYYWNDVWEKYHALFDPDAAWTNFTANPVVDDGGTKSFTYHFINYFKQYGVQAAGYSADFPSYLVTEDSFGKKYYMVYNPLPINKTVRFYDASDAYIGSVNVNAGSYAITSNLITDETPDNILVYPVPYKPGSGGSYDASGITFQNIGANAKIKIFNIAGELVFETIQNSFFVWDAKNRYGNKIASGVYIYYVTSNGGKTFKGKIAIER